MIKAVVISDTHMPRMGKRLPERLLEELRSADVILHAGDWTHSSVLAMLRSYGPVHGVAGNNDGPLLVRRLGYRRIIKLEQVKIGIVHGHGPGRREDTELRASQSFAADEADIVVFGHTHIPFKRMRDGKLLFNPGSAADKRRAGRYSFGVITIDGRRFSAKHIYYDIK